MKAISPINEEVIRGWAIGEVKIIGPYSGVSMISNEVSKYNKKYGTDVFLQSSVRFLLNPDETSVVRVWVVERVE